MLYALPVGQSAQTVHWSGSIGSGSSMRICFTLLIFSTGGVWARDCIQGERKRKENSWRWQHYRHFERSSMTMSPEWRVGEELNTLATQANALLCNAVGDLMKTNSSSWRNFELSCSSWLHFVMPALKKHTGGTGLVILLPFILES